MCLSVFICVNLWLKKPLFYRSKMMNEIFTLILLRSLGMSAVVLALWLLSPILTRFAPARWRYALWICVAAGFLLPPLPTESFLAVSLTRPMVKQPLCGQQPTSEKGGMGGCVEIRQPPERNRIPPRTVLLPTSFGNSALPTDPSGRPLSRVGLIIIKGPRAAGGLGPMA